MYIYVQGQEVRRSSCKQYNSAYTAACCWIFGVCSVRQQSFRRL